MDGPGADGSCLIMLVMMMITARRQLLLRFHVAVGGGFVKICTQSAGAAGWWLRKYAREATSGRQPLRPAAARFPFLPFRPRNRPRNMKVEARKLLESIPSPAFSGRANKHTRCPCTPPLHGVSISATPLLRMASHMSFSKRLGGYPIPGWSKEQTRCSIQQPP